MGYFFSRNAQSPHKKVIIIKVEQNLTESLSILMIPFTFRESYTYAKIREKHHHGRNSSGASLPRARLVCVNAQESGFRGMALGGKSTSSTTTTTPTDYECYVPEACKKGVG